MLCVCTVGTNFRDGENVPIVRKTTNMRELQLEIRFVRFLHHDSPRGTNHREPQLAARCPHTAGGHRLCRTLALEIRRDAAPCRGFSGRRGETPYDIFQRWHASKAACPASSAAHTAHRAESRKHLSVLGRLRVAWLAAGLAVPVPAEFLAVGPTAGSAFRLLARVDDKCLLDRKATT